MTLTLAQRQFVRYSVVGLASNLLCYLVYLGLTGAGIHPKLAMTLLYGMGVLQTFVFNRRWTFRHGGARDSAFYRYCALYALGYLLNLAMLCLLVDLLAYPHQIVQGIMILALAMLLFLVQKFWVFRT